jgi:hypothetical protein
MGVKIPQLDFDAWKSQLFKDCERQGQLLAHNNLVDSCLKLLWESGAEPTVRAITHSGGKRQIAKVNRRLTQKKLSG